MSRSRSKARKKGQNNFSVTRIQWKPNVKSLRSVLDLHDEILAWSWVGMIDILPKDVIIIIIKKLAIELFPEFVCSLKDCVEWMIVDKKYLSDISKETFSARQNAIYAMATVFCIHRKVTIFHTRTSPVINIFMCSFSKKLNELLSLYENCKTEKNKSPSSVSWKRRHRQLLRVSDIWNNSIYLLEAKDE